MDLLTTLIHEFGHVLGHPDLPSHPDVEDVMEGTLEPGVRRLPQTSSANIDETHTRVDHVPEDLLRAVFASGGETHSTTALQEPRLRIDGSSSAHRQTSDGTSLDSSALGFDRLASSETRLYDSRRDLEGPAPSYDRKLDSNQPAPLDFESELLAIDEYFRIHTNISDDDFRLERDRKVLFFDKEHGK